jgi:hypothetical protein
MSTLALLLLLPTQPGLTAERSSNSSIIFRVNVGSTVQNRDFRIRAFFKRLTIKGNNNNVYISYSPVDSSINYYNKQIRRPLFWRFRRVYP